MSQGFCKSKKVFTLGFVNPTSLVLKIELHDKHARGTKGILGGPKESGGTKRVPEHEPVPFFPVYYYV